MTKQEIINYVVETPHNVNNLSVSHRKAIYVNCPLAKTFSHDKLKAPKSQFNKFYEYLIEYN